MFCEKCGNRLEDDQRFCGVCGEPVAPPEQPAAPTPAPAQQEYPAPAYAQPTDEQQFGYRTAPAQQEYPAPAYAPPIGGQQFGYQPAPEQPKKKSNKKRIAIIAAAIVVLIGAAVAVAFLTGMFKSDKNRVTEATTGAVHKIFDKFSEIKDDFSLDDYSSVDLKIEPGDLIKTAASSQGANLSWLKSAAIKPVIETDGDKMIASCGVVLNDVEIGNLNLVVDMSSGELLIGMDGLSDSLGRTTLSRSGRMPSLPAESVNSLTQMFSEMDTEEYADLIEEYIKTALDTLDDVTKSDGSFTAAGVTDSCTVYTIKITGKTLGKMSKAIMSKAVDDDVLKDLIEKFYSMSSLSSGSGIPSFEEFYSQWRSQMSQSLSMADEGLAQSSDDTMAVVTEYVDGDDLIGLKVEAGDTDFFFGFAADGGKFGVELTVNGVTVLTGSGDKDGDKLTGDIRVTLNGKDLATIRLDNFDIKDNEGAVEISLSADTLRRMGAESSVSQLLSGAALRIERQDKVVTFDLKVAGMSALKVSMTPAGKKSVSVNTDLPVKDLEEWKNTLNLGALKSKLIEAGVPEDLISSLFEQIG